ncbi:MAG: DUF4394 domain-containing protein [Pseudomonadota bacterium]
MRKNAIWAFSLTVLAAAAVAGCDDADITAGTDGLGSCTPETTLLAATEAGKLITFKSTDPTTSLSSVTITGLGGAGVAGMDVRPATGTIYLFSTDSKLYTVTTAGVATQVGAMSYPEYTSVGGFNFNPVPDRIRPINANGSVNKRVHPDTGAVPFTDTALAYAPTDVNVGQSFALRGMAYKAAAAGVTTAYVIDATQNVLATLGSVNGSPQSPNGGQLFTVGALGVDVSTDVTQQTFEVDGPNGVGYFVHEGNVRTLRQVDLGTGTSKPCGATVPAVGGGQLSIKAMTVVLPIAP